ncbi:MAG TPA: amidohydrolase family protein [Terriglobia bacterium]|nr:amidohydrolase family protein [Terriglobia bacterium]
MCASLWLTGGRVAIDGQTSVRASLEIADGKIRRVHSREAHTPPDATIDLENRLILPGLINAHDHLEFNLFPRLGRGPYSNSADWARDIYQPGVSPVREHLSVPKNIRMVWGGLKNLLCGVTTVCHHNPYDEQFQRGFPVHVVRHYGWAHSLTFEKDVFSAFDATQTDQPFIIHAGEGTDERSRLEVFDLDRMGVLDSRTVLVHGVAFSEAGHSLRQRRGAGLVWCPTSNQFVLGTTLDVHALSDLESIALGSDSALTARGNLLDEIHEAREEDIPAPVIYRMVTETAASILRLDEGEGRLESGSVANIIAIPWNGASPCEAVAQLDSSQIDLVMIFGRIKLASEAIMATLPSPRRAGLERMTVDSVQRWVHAPVTRLLSETAAHLGDEIRLAGKRISA